MLSWRMRRGATLPELLAALALLAVLLGLAVPEARAARDRALLQLEARALAAAHADTRAVAMRRGARTELVVSPARYQQRDAAGAILWERPGPLREGIALTGPLTAIVFDSRGYSIGAANRTYTLSRGSRTLRVVISRPGRLRILP